MSTGPSIVDDVRRLLNATEKGSLTQAQFETKRSALLLSAEATLIQRREALSDGLTAGTITGMQAADIRAELDRAEKDLREAASLVGLTAANKASAPSADSASSAASNVDSVTSDVHGRRPSSRRTNDAFVIGSGERVRHARLSSSGSLDGGGLARRLGSVFPTALGAIVFAPVGVMTLLGHVESWAPIWGVVMLLMAVGCLLTARDRWVNPDPT